MAFQNVMTTWLSFVAFLRFVGICIGYYDAQLLRAKVFTIASLTETSPLQGRTFGIWTSVSCVLCLICIKYPKEKGIVLATLMSFIFAFLYFVLEYGFFQTVALDGFIKPAIISSKFTDFLLYLISTIKIIGVSIVVLCCHFYLLHCRNERRRAD